MREQQRTNRSYAGLIAGLSAAVIAVSGAVAWWTWGGGGKQVVNQQPKPEVVQPQPPKDTNTQPVENVTSIYLLKDTGKGFDLSPQTVKVTGSNPTEVLTAVFDQLLTVQNQADLSTTIPEGTKLLGLKIDNDGIHVNLSKEFTAGGGTSSMVGRVGQVVYTASTLDPNAKVFIEIDGEKIEVLGGEGLDLEQPLTRKSFRENFEL